MTVPLITLILAGCVIFSVGLFLGVWLSGTNKLTDD